MILEKGEGNSTQYGFTEKKFKKKKQYPMLSATYET